MLAQGLPPRLGRQHDRCGVAPFHVNTCTNSTGNLLQLTSKQALDLLCLQLAGKTSPARDLLCFGENDSYLTFLSELTGIQYRFIELQLIKPVLRSSDNENNATVRERADFVEIHYSLTPEFALGCCFVSTSFDRVAVTIHMEVCQQEAFGTWSSQNQGGLRIKRGDRTTSAKRENTNNEWTDRQGRVP